MKAKDFVVTYFDSPRSNIAISVTLDVVLQRFKNGTYSERISYVRKVLAEKGASEYASVKKGLPAIAFCGEFSGGHAKKNLKIYNNLLH